MLINGTLDDDVLNGTADSDQINGLAGDDTINSGLGNDTVNGGVGTDLLVVDYASLGSPGSGIYSINNSDGSGYFYAYSNSGATVDQVTHTGIERFNVIGTAYDDTLSTGAGNDTINAGAGNDTISSGAGSDVIRGGAGNDLIMSGVGGDVIDGGLGLDTLAEADFSTATANLSFRDDGIANPTITLATGDSVSDIEYFINLRTGGGNDRISFVTRQNNVLRTGAGNDIINSGLGSDTIEGGAGTDLLVVNYASLGSPGYGIYSINNSDGSGYFSVYSDGGATFDQMTHTSIERFNVIGTAYDDTLATGAGNDTINAGAGNDTVTGGGGNDTLLGGKGNDIVTGGGGNDQFVFDINAAFTTEIGVDTIQGFVQASDKLVLDKTTFTALTSPRGPLAAREFAVINQVDGAELAAGTSAALVVFNQATGDLFYNPDGTAAGLSDGGLFAKLSGIPLLTAADLHVRV